MLFLVRFGETLSDASLHMSDNCSAGVNDTSWASISMSTAGSLLGTQKQLVATEVRPSSRTLGQLTEY